MKLALPTLFDVLYWLVWAVVYTAALSAGVLAADLVWAETALSRGAALALGYFVFLHAFVVVLGLLRRLLQPRLSAGVVPVGGNRHFLAWGLQSVFQGIFVASFCAEQIHFLFWLRYLHYRLMGMRLAPGTVIGTGATLRQVEMIEVGAGSTIGIGATLSCHVNPDGKSHKQAPIRIGERTLIGAYSVLGPGTTIGDACVIGAGATLPIDVRVGDGANVGAHVYATPGVSIGAGARVGAGSVVLDDVPAGERWAGVPARRIDHTSARVRPAAGERTS